MKIAHGRLQFHKVINCDYTLLENYPILSLPSTLCNNVVEYIYIITHKHHTEAEKRVEYILLACLFTDIKMNKEYSLSVATTTKRR